ncbi:MAG: efflux RND transporter periplasmic adaptor subunit [Chitinophagales bacterium]|nr:efflux RND transporter periplasmic adaptor subunit [Chitinophagales bacterium]
MFKKNRLIIILVIVAVVLVAVLLIGKKQGWIGGSKALEVSVEKVSRRSIVERVSASGKIYPQRDVKLSPDVSGEVVELYVTEGDSVVAGQPLAKIKPDIYQAILDRARAALNTSKANHLQAKSALTQASAEYEKAEKNYNRNKSLHDQKVISDADWELIETAYKTAKAGYESAQMNVDAAQYNVQSAEASVKEAEEDLRKTSIFSPLNGIVTRLNVEQGERVLGTTQFEGTDMMHISDLNAIEAWVDVSENDVLRVKVYDTCEIKLDAYPDRKFKGLVEQIGKSAKVPSVGQSEQVTNFQVKIWMLPDSYRMLKDSVNQKFPFLPGMSASVDIMTRRAVNAISVPIQSVTTRTDIFNEKDKEKEKAADTSKAKVAGPPPGEAVFFNDNGKVKAVNVKTGIQDDEYIEILSGLKGDEEIVSGPFSAISRQLKDGDAIKVVDKSKLFKSDEKK